MKQNNFDKSNQAPAGSYLPKSLSAQKILTLRAKKLAEKNEDDTVELGQKNYIRFGLGKEHSFGIDFNQIKEVIPYSSLTPLPLAPDFVAGIINYRGRLIPIVDLIALFALKKVPDGDNKYIIVVCDENITAGFLTRFIDDSENYDITSLQPPLAVNNKFKQGYIYGLHNGVTAILNVRVLLRDFQNELKDIYKNRI